MHDSKIQSLKEKKDLFQQYPISDGLIAHYASVAMIAVFFLCATTINAQDTANLKTHAVTVTGGSYAYSYGYIYVPTIQIFPDSSFSVQGDSATAIKQLLAECNRRVQSEIVWQERWYKLYDQFTKYTRDVQRISNNLRTDILNHLNKQKKK
jgi:hypothetical protein